MQQQHFLIVRPIANSMPVSGSQCSEATAITRMLGATTSDRSSAPMLACWRSRQAGRSTSPCGRVVDDARRLREGRQELNLRLGVMGVMGASYLGPAVQTENSDSLQVSTRLLRP